MSRTGVSTSMMKDKSVRESLRAALADDGKISDTEVLQIIASTLDGKGILQRELDDLGRLRKSRSMQDQGRKWLEEFITLCEKQKTIKLTFDRAKQAYHQKGSKPPSGWYQSDYGKSDRGGRGSCAIRVSSGLQEIGWKFRQFNGKFAWKDARTGRKLPVNAAELRDYLNRTSLGRGVKIDPRNPITRYRQGIIFLSVSGASGHITLWDGNNWENETATFEDASWVRSSNWLAADGSNATFWDLRPHWI